MKNILIVVAAVLLVAGCADLTPWTPSWLTIGPDYTEPQIADPGAPAPDAGYPTTNKTATGEFAPADPSADPRTEITTNSVRRWWAQFNDDILTGLIEAAVSNNLTFLVAQQRLVEARWRNAGAWGALLPSIDLAGKATRSEYHPNTGSGGGRTVHRDLFHGGFDATWEIDIFGGNRRSEEEAYRNMEAANYSLADAWVSLTSEIGSQYVALRTVQERLRVARANLKLQSETYDILKSRLDSGIGDELAVNQAKYNVEQTRASIPSLLSQEEGYMNALAILAGTMPGALHGWLQELPDRDWLVAPQKLSSIPLDVIRSRPDVRVAERNLAAQVAHVGVAKSLLFPKFYINGTLGLESVKVQKFFQRDSLYGTIGPSFSWPLFQGGNLYANLKAEEAKMDAAALSYEKAVQTAVGETRDAYSAYTQQYHRYLSLQGAVKAAKDAENISQDLYKNGLADFNNVLDAQRSLLTLEEALTISRGQISLNLIALYKALGGGVVMGEDK
jgi:NodT family efflux transporter outer membrane factor (OMF) lipoprotein